MNESKDEFRIELSYKTVGDYRYPILALPECEEKPIGKYGMMRLSYIKSHRKGTYSELLMSGRLNSHLAEIDDEAHRMVDALIAKRAQEAGIDEQMKAADPFRWVQEMNNCKAAAEEIVMNELICCQSHSHEPGAIWPRFFQTAQISKPPSPISEKAAFLFVKAAAKGGQGLPARRI